MNSLYVVIYTNAYTTQKVKKNNQNWCKTFKKGVKTSNGSIRLLL